MKWFERVIAFLVPLFERLLQKRPARKSESRDAAERWRKRGEDR